MKITPEIIIAAYRQGLFPMADSRRGGKIGWYDPEMRGVLPLRAFHVPKRLQRTLRRGVFEITFDRDFKGVMEGCAGTRAETWISAEIIGLYTELHRMGYGHSVEAWRDGRLVGGVYGLALGGAFFGESMFSIVTDASKVALAHLVARLVENGFVLFDTQYINDHLLQFGAFEVPRAEYLERLHLALEKSAVF